ncbi:ABC transporter ATP-binding protein [Mesorhizobium sp. M7A.F.Ca.US.006.01.1.1]|uniref:ABC transporter ATP-binding protein n=1 Tax=Mesorhizobium sp. M7A.F.Ca.US.006.01.1.1 TaxID=2496707 RepID=UPI000FCB7CB3|nr:ABC transporter ATP-binding protein [Mesorhizobium sp. M7A.F.Ca.US.006.01.1.1]RUZ76657.1 ABC transporter ATP-binding protein [Mesorhizobium sp. M7A.F.Ca.US.006.01.1.1]
MTALVEIDGLSIALPEHADRALAVEDVSLRIERGEVLCLVGESGSGKSVLAAAIAGLLPSKQLRIAAGAIRFDGRDIAGISEASFRLLRGKRIGFIFQEPMSALNPVLTIGRQIEETLAAHGGGDRKARTARVLELARATRLPDPETIIHRYPHQLSGGQRQRVMIAMAIANDPDLLIADEPTTALDVTTQAEILRLILEIRERLGLAILFITHDFGVVADIADRVVVMKEGRVIESGKADDVLEAPSQPYTRRLIEAVPVLHANETDRQDAGEPFLVVRGLSKTYRDRRAPWRRQASATRALDGVDLTIGRGETVALVGESGSGKTTLGQCVVGLADWDEGSLSFDGRDLAGTTRERTLRPRIQMVFQDPFASLNPRHRVRRILTEAAIVNGLSRERAEESMSRLLVRVGLDPSAADRFPHAFSGGQRQRIGLARALMLEPDLLVADEPVSALDVSIQAQILDLLAEIKRDLGLSMLFITHDLRVASAIADRIVVMQSGKIVEDGSAEQVLTRPGSDYARALLAAVPGLSWERSRSRIDRAAAE